jgi:hypothetical protein
MRLTTLPSTSNLLQRAWKENALLTIVSLAMLPLMGIALVGLLVDHQLITGVPAWMKPLKFAISTIAYCLTFLYLLTFVQGYPRIVKFIGTITAICLAAEIVLITLQVLRGTSSHFNFTTLFNGIVFETMGGFVTVLWLAGSVLVVLLLRQRLSDIAWTWALRFSIITALTGMAVAFLMIAQPGATIGISGAHSVGVADGGAGLPFLGWSTVGGDLRIPHFFGLHGLQVLLIVGWLVTMTRSWLNMHHRVALVMTAGVGYLSFIGLLTWQALRSQSIIHPDMLSLLAFGGLFSLVLVIECGIMIHGYRKLTTATLPVLV